MGAGSLHPAGKIVQELLQRIQGFFAFFQFDLDQRFLQAGFGGRLCIRLAGQQIVPIRQRARGVAAPHARQGGRLQGFVNRLVLRIVVGHAAEQGGGFFQPPSLAGHFAQAHQGRGRLGRLRVLLHQRFVSPAGGIQPPEHPLGFGAHPKHVDLVGGFRLRGCRNQRLFVFAALELGYHDFIGGAIGKRGAGIVANDRFIVLQRFSIPIHLPQAIGAQVDSGSRRFGIGGILYQSVGQFHRFGRTVEIIQTPSICQPRIPSPAFLRILDEQRLQDVGGLLVAFLPIGPVAPAEQRFGFGGRRLRRRQRLLEPCGHLVVVPLLVRMQSGEVERGIGRVGRIPVFFQQAFVGGACAAGIAGFQAAIAQIVGSRRPGSRVRTIHQQGVQDRGGILVAALGDGQFRATQFGARRLLALRKFGRDPLVETLGARLVAHLAIAFPGSIQRRRYVRAVGIVAQQSQILPHGRLVESAQVDAIGETHLLVGAQRPGRDGQQRKKQEHEQKALHHEPGASVANEMFQMSACRQVSSTRTTCS